MREKQHVIISIQNSLLFSSPESRDFDEQPRKSTKYLVKIWVNFHLFSREIRLTNEAIIDIYIKFIIFKQKQSIKNILFEISESQSSQQGGGGCGLGYCIDLEAMVKVD